MWKLFVGLALVVALIVGFLRWNEVQERRLKEAYEILGSTKAQVALLHAEKDSLVALYAAADALDSDVVAGMRIVTRADTVYVPMATRSTTTRSDGTRYAILTDTTSHGFEIEITTEAPPSPSPLSIGYELRIPSFSPTIGFVGEDGKYTAVVTWEGMDFTIDNALFIPTRPEDTSSFSVVGGSGLTLSHELTPDAYLGVRFEKALSYGLDVGYGDGFFVRLGIEKTLW